MAGVAGMGWLARLARGDGSDGVAVAVRCDGGTVGTTRAWVVGEVRRGKREGGGTSLGRVEGTRGWREETVGSLPAV